MVSNSGLKRKSCRKISPFSLKWVTVAKKVAPTLRVSRDFQPILIGRGTLSKMLATSVANPRRTSSWFKLGFFAVEPETL